MYHRRYLLVVAGLIVIYSSLVAGAVSNANDLDSRNKITAGANETDGIIVVIHYGLNDSHSHDWVQENSEGIVGITYFQRFEGSTDEGTLMYRTISPDGSKNEEPVTTGTRLEKSVLLYDELDKPHIFVARSNNTDQVVDHYFQDIDGQWQSETIIHFYNEGGKFIYELSADKGPDGSFHLLILKSRSDIDSDDYMDAWINSYLYHLTNKTGSWEKELIHNYNMAYTYDHYIKSSARQDIKVDNDGYVHVTFSEQINAYNDPSRLLYATNKSGTWETEIALSNDYGVRDDAGWFPSLCLDNDGVPYISCMYVNRVLTYSAVYCKLFLLKRLGPDSWQSEVLAEYDDGYYGSDGRCYTGALSHLIFDSDNTPHIIFSDIASSHYTPYQRLNVGNIRYGVLEGDTWDFTTIYRQPLPTSFFSATEMFGMCMVVSDQTHTIRVIGQEMIITGENQYTCGLVEFSWPKDPTSVETLPENALPETLHLSQNYPNPFNPNTEIEFTLPTAGQVKLEIFNIMGQRITTLVNRRLEAGHHTVSFDGGKVASGVYLYRLQAGEFVESKKMMLLK